VSATAAPTTTPLPPAARATVDAGRARAIGFGVLGFWGITRWAGMVAPSGFAALLGIGLLVLAFGWALGRLERARIDERLRWAGVFGAGLVVLAGVLLLAGAPAGLVLDPRGWGALAGGVGQGLGALPRVTVPYEGADPWVRTVILAGGGLLLVLAALAVALLPERPSTLRRARAALPLLILPTVPGFLIEGRDGTVSGLVLFGALALALWLEDVASHDAGRALAFLGAAGVLGALAVPVLDRDTPWLDYERLAASLAPPPTARFDWTQRYGPLDWPRTGREVLRVKMKRPVYIKAQNLDGFDGTAWHATVTQSGLGATIELPTPPRPSDAETIRITLKSMASWPVLGAGAIIGFRQFQNGAIPTGSPGTFESVSRLEPGDSYRVRVYAPDAGEAKLSSLDGDYPSWASAYRTLELPRATGPPEDVEFPAFGAPAAKPLVLDPQGGVHRSAAVVLGSDYGRAYRLARSLTQGISTPWDMAVRVRRYLQSREFTYAEQVVPTRRPLEDFLFKTRRGYCQHFAGAAALLLRMAGVPARVVTGFTPGVRDASRDEYVIRDEDAHAWVEVWIPHRGWETIDPTPATAPALLSLGAGSRGPRGSLRAPSLQAGEPISRAGARQDGGGGGFPWAWVLGLVALAGAGAAVVRRGASDGPVDELERALARCGRPAAPGATLRDVERRLGPSPPARAYVRALREARYADGPPPDRATRRALRTELARGLGPGGKLRAWWSLPPRLR
jgi:transglutaminase-like putative cysteine protease